MDELYINFVAWTPGSTEPGEYKEIADTAEGAYTYLLYWGSVLDWCMGQVDAKVPCPLEKRNELYVSARRNAYATFRARELAAG